jgi:hypothetical protein
MVTQLAMIMVLKNPSKDLWSTNDLAYHAKLPGATVISDLSDLSDLKRERIEKVDILGPTSDACASYARASSLLRVTLERSEAFEQTLTRGFGSTWASNVTWVTSLS